MNRFRPLEVQIIRKVVLTNPLRIVARQFGAKTFDGACRDRLSRMAPFWSQPWRGDKPHYGLRMFFGQVVQDYFAAELKAFATELGQKGLRDPALYDPDYLFCWMLVELPEFWPVCHAEAPRYVAWPELPAAVCDWQAQLQEELEELQHRDPEFTESIGALCRISSNPHIYTMIGQYQCADLYCWGACFEEFHDDNVSSYGRACELIDWVKARPDDDRYDAVCAIEHMVPRDRNPERSWNYRDPTRAPVNLAYWEHRFGSKAKHKRLGFYSTRWSTFKP